MLTVRPDYYEHFHCIADRCRHSCCIGWEIDIDEESLVRFSSVKGAFAKRLKSAIDIEPEPHFILDAQERCPFLRSDGLCDMILALGESSLCDICTEHPRFYNTFPDRVEMGLGMCCEEAARLLTEGKESVKLIYEGEESGDTEAELFRLRDEILLCLADSTIAFSARAQKAASLFGIKTGHFDAKKVSGFYGKLERMDEQWSQLLSALADCHPDMDSLLNDIRYERIAEYFLFRHFSSAADWEDAAARFVFSILSMEIIAALDSLGYREDALRLYSAEIEYSDENIDIILEAIKNGTLSA